MLLALLFFSPALVGAQSQARPSGGKSLDSPGFGLSVGQFDIARIQTAEFGVDYGFAPVPFYGLQPHVGVGATEEESFFLYVGLRKNFALEGRFTLTPSLAVSYYEKGDGKDLGHEIEFRSGLGLFYSLPRGGAVGLGVYHLSNASISSTNPGANSVLLRFRF